jgi:probable F420-dependent oxidoreductase
VTVKFTLGVPGLILYPGRIKHWSKHLTPAQTVRVAQHADRLGYDYFRFSEHLVMSNEMTPAMGARWSHSVSSTAFIAGATTNIRMLTLIVIPYHEPVNLAKSLSTIDHLSGGRLSIIAGTGYMDWEFEALGVPYEERVAITDEHLAAMIELWTSDAPTFDGKYTSFRDVVFDPKPAQSPHPPILIGGYTKAALRRVARIGDGWILQQVTTRNEIPEMIDYIQAQPEFQARPRHLELGTSLWEGKTHPRTHELIEAAKPVYEPDAILEQVQILAELGVTIVGADAALRPPPPDLSTDDALRHHLEQIEWFAENVLPEARLL